jgi:hypothetical protein
MGRSKPSLKNQDVARQYRSGQSPAPLYRLEAIGEEALSKNFSSGHASFRIPSHKSLERQLRVKKANCGRPRAIDPAETGQTLPSYSDKG